jgi:hypothetical protein
LKISTGRRRSLFPRQFEYSAEDGVTPSKQPRTTRTNTDKRERRSLPQGRPLRGQLNEKKSKKEEKKDLKAKTTTDDTDRTDKRYI